MNITIQQAYEGIKQWFEQPDHTFGYLGGGDCVYRVQNEFDNQGREQRCAVGCLIPDAEYTDSFERESPDYVIATVFGDDENLHAFLLAAQGEHDRLATSGGGDNLAAARWRFLKQLDSLAGAYGVQTP